MDDPNINAYDDSVAKRTCPTCARSARDPFRVYLPNGKVAEGCIDSFHTGHLVTPSESLFWHNRKCARQWRVAEKKRRASE